MVDETLNTVAVLSDNTVPSPPPVNTPGSPEAPPPGPENAPDTLTALKHEVSELKKSLDGILARQVLPADEQIRRELQHTAAQRDQVHGELKQLQRTTQLQKLADRCGFNDVEYLDFILQKHQVDPIDTAGADRFLQEFKKASPRYFSVPLKPGSGSRPGTSPHQDTKLPPDGANRMAVLESMLAGAPEFI